MSDTKDQFTMQDPTKQYPQPPFERQPQSAPGLAKQMNPKPGHGEASYKSLSFQSLQGVVDRRIVA